MAFRNTTKGSSFTFFLILLLGISFLTPLYHSHLHTSGHHQESSGDHAFFHDGPSHNGLSANDQHNGFHLHIKKDIGTDSRLQFKDKSLKPDLCAETEVPASAEPLKCRRAEHEEGLVSQSITYDLPYGLSPPTV